MKTYKDIDGWFDYEDFFDEIVAKAPQHFSVVVEMGCWLGRSSAYLAQRIKESGKYIEYHAVDTWKGSVGDSAFSDVLAANNGDVYDLFIKNMVDCGVMNYINPLRMDSVEASKCFADNSVDFLFLDGAHDYDSVKRDLAAWIPKVKKGGIMAGHDFGHPPVKQAVLEALPNARDYVGATSHQTWIVNL